jgi:hypothetical protein
MVTIRVYTHDELEDMKQTAIKITNTLPSDFDKALDIMVFVIKTMVEDTDENFIERYRECKIHRVK